LDRAGDGSVGSNHEPQNRSCNELAILLRSTYGVYEETYEKKGLLLCFLYRRRSLQEKIRNATVVLGRTVGCPLHVPPNNASKFAPYTIT
jgi:hypothetical protein